MKTWLQNWIPQHGLSRCLGFLAHTRLGFLTTLAIRVFVKKYHVNLSEAVIGDVTQFKTFNAFFTRELKSELRNWAAPDNVMTSPVDGMISELGVIQQDQLLQAKGAYFSLRALCGGDETIASHFVNGSFVTTYLAPKDYHRIHMPIAGKLLNMIYVPGNLFSVNPVSVQHIPNLFARNERVISLFETQYGKMAVIAVGAMIVGSIATTWQGIIAPSQKRCTQSWSYLNQSIYLKRGDEWGRFLLGSTVIILMEANRLSWHVHLIAGSKLQIGCSLGLLR